MPSIAKERYSEIEMSFALVDEDIQRYEEFKDTAKKNML